MPCNLTARADAKISNATLAKLLTPQVVEQVVRALAKEQGLEGNVSVFDLGLATGTRYNEIQLAVDGIEFSVQRNRDGTLGVYVSAKAKKPAEAQALANALQQRLALVLGLLLQQKVKRALSQKFAVESTSTAPNGALVIRMEM